jgi:hypothetical protein
LRPQEVRSKPHGCGLRRMGEPPPGRNSSTGILVSPGESSTQDVRWLRL